jgi:hypothetical protein
MRLGSSENLLLYCQHPPYGMTVTVDGICSWAGRTKDDEVWEILSVDEVFRLYRHRTCVEWRICIDNRRRRETLTPFGLPRIWEETENGLEWRRSVILLMRIEALEEA